MKAKLLITLIALVAFAAGASAQQDPLDAGAADSVIVVFTHTPDVAAGDSSLVIEVYIVNDNDLGGISIGWGWTPEWMQMDSAYFSPLAAASFPSFNGLYFPTNLAGSNANQTFQTTGLRFSGSGLPPSTGRGLIATYAFHVDSLFPTDEITIDLSSNPAMLFTNNIGNTEFAPQYAGGISFFDPSGVSSTGGDNLPIKFDLNQNYPNPFNPVTKINFDLPQRAHTTLTVFNVLGQSVATLVNEDLAADRYQVEWNGTTDGGSKVASGIYFYRLTADEKVMTKKMMLLK